MDRPVMADADLIATISVDTDSSAAARDAIRASRHYLHPAEPLSPQMGPYDSREPTPNPPDDDPYIELRFSSIPRSSHGFLVGRNPRCDIVLPNLSGLSHYHFSITFDDQRRLVVKDLCSTTGTRVVYNTRVYDARRGFQWIIGGDETADNAAVVVVIYHDIRFRILVAVSEKCLYSPAYAENVDAYCRGAADAGMLFRDLDLKVRQDTERPTAIQTPRSGALCLQKEIGRGAFGVVTRFWDVTTACQHVVKSPPSDLIQAGKVDLALWRNEAHILSLVSQDFHRHIVQFLGATFAPHPQLSFEFVPLGSLDSHDDISKVESYTVLCQCLSALTYLHGRQPPIVHRDIKPANILVQHRGGGYIEVKLGDFGLSRDYDNLSTICGTRTYLAPEVYVNEQYCLAGGSERQSYTSAVDIWSLGVVVYELTSSLPRWKSNCVNWCEKILDAFWQDWQNAPSDLHGFLLDHMLVLSPSERGSASVCHEHALRVNINENEAMPPCSTSSDTSDTSDRLHLAAPPDQWTTCEFGEGSSDDDGAATIVLGRGSSFNAHTSVPANADSAETQSSWPTPQASPQQTRGIQLSSVIPTQPRAPPVGSVLVQHLWSVGSNDNTTSSPAPLEETNNAHPRHSTASLEMNKSGGWRIVPSLAVAQSHQSTRDLLFDKPDIVRVVFGRQEVSMRAAAPFFLNATQMLDAADITKGTRDVVMRQLRQHKIIKWQGSGRRKMAWVPFHHGVFLCQHLGLEDRLRRLLHHAQLPLPPREENFLTGRGKRKLSHFATFVWNGKQVQHSVVNITRLLGTVGVTERMVDTYLDQNPDMERAEVGAYGFKGKYISYDDVGSICAYFEFQGQDELRRALLSTLLPVSSTASTTSSAQKVPYMMRESSSVEVTQRAPSPPALPADAPSARPSSAVHKAEDGTTSYFTEADFQHGSYLAPACTSHLELLLGRANTPKAEAGRALGADGNEKGSDGARESSGYAAWILRSSELASMAAMAADERVPETKWW